MQRVTCRSRPIRRAYKREYPPDHRRLDPACHLPVLAVHATGSLLTLVDGEKIGQGRWEGKWLTRCSLHGTEAWHRSRPKALRALRDASFCAQCFRDALMSPQCPACLAPRRGCALCSPGK